MDVHEDQDVNKNSEKTSFILKQVQSYFALSAVQSPRAVVFFQLKRKYSPIKRETDY